MKAIIGGTIICGKYTILILPQEEKVSPSVLIEVLLFEVRQCKCITYLARYYADIRDKA